MSRAERRRAAKLRRADTAARTENVLLAIAVDDDMAPPSGVEHRWVGLHEPIGNSLPVLRSVLRRLRAEADGLDAKARRAALSDLLAAIRAPMKPDSGAVGAALGAAVKALASDPFSMAWVMNAAALAVNLSGKAGIVFRVGEADGLRVAVMAADEPFSLAAIRSRNDWRAVQPVGGSPE